MLKEIVKGLVILLAGGAITSIFAHFNSELVIQWLGGVSKTEFHALDEKVTALGTSKVDKGARIRLITVLPDQTGPLSLWNMDANGKPNLHLNFAAPTETLVPQQLWVVEQH